MKRSVNDEALDQLFREARTYSAWQDRPVSDEILRQLYDLMKWGPTSANMCPARILFLCNPGYGDPAGLYPRNPRLAFDEACRLL